MNEPANNQNELLGFMKSLSDAGRIKIAGLLGVEALSTTQIAERLGMKPAEVQRHLDQLTASGLAHQEGGLYRLDGQALEKLTRQVLAQSHPPAAEYEGDEFEVKTLRAYLRRDGTLKSIPTQHKKLMVILQHLVKDFKTGQQYPESQVNQILGRYNEDHAALRRYLVDNGLLRREKGIYWKRPGRLTVQDQELIDIWRLEEQQPFSGWDFTHLKGRIFEPSPPWSYEKMVQDLLPGASSVLDIGTGGGEKLLEFSELLPARTYATEGWRPNIPLAGKNLAPHSIEVVPYNAEEESRMPFTADSFALVIDRHEAFDGEEIARILARGGVFLTQQADGPDLSGIFDFKPYNPQVTLSSCASDLQRAGLVIEFSGESTSTMRFADVGALVYYAHAAPWDFPADFSVDGYATQLLQLHKAGNLTFDVRYFMIRARKPA